MNLTSRNSITNECTDKIEIEASVFHQTVTNLLSAHRFLCQHTKQKPFKTTTVYLDTANNLIQPLGYEDAFQYEQTYYSSKKITAPLRG